ncbi:MAG: hypothetical protein GY940_43445, partial [bacterium]|nr:hypothetical protein [bacterium]
MPPLKLQYKDYSQWQQLDTVKKVLQRQETFWIKQFAGEIPLLNLPTDYPRPAIQSFAGNLTRFDIGEDETKSLNEMAGLEGATMFMVLLGIYTLFLAKLSSQEDIVVGTPIAARGHADLQQVIGMFVNTLAIRNHPPGDKSFKGFLNQVKERTLASFDNQDYLFEDLVENVTVRRDTSRNPLFDAMFMFHNIDDPSGKLPAEDLGGAQIKG